LHMEYLVQICCKQLARIIESFHDTTQGLKDLREYLNVDDDYESEEQRIKNGELSRWMNSDY
jgi:hypothetical protein